MSILTFKGGIHPKDGKAMSKAKAIKTLTPKGEIVIPLSQHIGAPATPCVEVGDRVLVGQKIGEASGFISANVHSSVAGTVKKIEPRMIASGAMVNCVVIENDDSYEEYIWELKDYEDMSKDDIRAAIKEAGIVGMGGAGFPTHVKLTPKDDDAIEYVIVNKDKAGGGGREGCGVEGGPFISKRKQLTCCSFFPTGSPAKPTSHSFRGMPVSHRHVAKQVLWQAE